MKNNIYLEETHETAVAMRVLLVFFKRFFAPYSLLIIITMVLACGVIATDLLLPKLLSDVIDRYINVSARRVAPATLKQRQFSDSTQLQVCNEAATFVLPAAQGRLDRDLSRELGRSGMLLPGKYYFTMLTSEKYALSVQYPNLFFQSPTYLFVSYEDMSKLERSDLLVLRQDDVSGIAKTAVIFLCVLVAGFLLNFAQVYLVERTSQRIMHDIRMAIFEHLQKLSLAFFHANPVGRLVTRATNDVQNLHEMFNALFANIVKDLLLIAGITGVLFWINWRLGLVCYAVLPLLLIGTIYFSSKSRSAFRLVRIKVAVLNAHISENLAGISVVKAFCREQRNEKRFYALNEENYVANMRQTVVFAVFSPLVDLARLSAIALIIWYGGGQTIRDAITLGTLVIFLYYVRMFFRPIQDLAEKYNIIQSAFASLERIYLLFIDASFIDEPDSPLAARKLKGRIDFQNVSFSYNNREQVLQDVTLNVKAGETIAIVGPTGAGKTTIINLLERFYDVQQGVILIDGSNIMHMEKRLLRRSIGLVMQDVFLFGGTIRNNITLGREYSEAEIARALAVSNANEVIARLPHGLDEEINQGGKTLSSGERQLLAFARAVILDPVILVFDEATSNIDPLTEGLIQNALEKIMLDRTCIVIAHRFSTIRNADRIVVMHKGRIHEEGSHDELIRAGGMYTRLARLQQLEHAAV